MREAVGGAMSLQIIVIFMLIINGYLAFSVNYTKAFRTKNEIRSIIEKNEGLTEPAKKQIGEFMLKTNYKTNERFQSWCEKNDYLWVATGPSHFCVKKQTVDITGNNDPTSKYKGAYYTVATFVNIDIPIINNILPMAGNLFVVKGETALIYSSGNNSEISGAAS